MGSQGQDCTHGRGGVLKKAGSGPARGGGGRELSQNVCGVRIAGDADKDVHQQSGRVGGASEPFEQATSGRRRASQPRCTAENARMDTLSQVAAGLGTLGPVEDVAPLSAPSCLSRPSAPSRPGPLVASKADGSKIKTQTQHNNGTARAAKSTTSQHTPSTATGPSIKRSTARSAASRGNRVGVLPALEASNTIANNLDLTSPKDR
ncbi:unnamed protein product [Vitrella brassicaformis CCMP3155]|uniref:Uncharacterized protein n=1 Tax=Vitrella brassicaformis (strain CCMP3155) TaxID=1169540 RepID=A0A0G4EKF5_VITBC|nr:unnamed protein product [Vitrella brassicaformis CCMP3155]|eukprot:CEL97040.1 unnamed protein product [Vitrella brassicaformis CCMP3155]